jgi:hypothetical protein
MIATGRAAVREFSIVLRDAGPNRYCRRVTYS